MSRLQTHAPPACASCRISKTFSELPALAVILSVAKDPEDLDPALPPNLFNQTVAHSFRHPKLVIGERPLEPSTQKKISKVGMFFATIKHHTTHHEFTSNSPRCNHPKTTKIPQILQNPPQKHHTKNYLPSRNRAASRSGSPAIKILPCAAVRSYGTRL
jgi:hypothetical protein